MTEVDGAFVSGANLHYCPPLPGRAKAAEIRKEVKATGCEHVFDSAPEIVEKVLLQQVASGDLACLANVSLPGSVGSISKRKRQKVLPSG